MKKIDLKPYNIDGVDKEGQPIDIKFDIKENLAALLFHPNLNLGGKVLLEQAEFAKKIEACEEEFILLENAEYNKLTAAADLTEGLARHYVEFISRIYNAQDVEVEEK